MLHFRARLLETLHQQGMLGDFSTEASRTVNSPLDFNIGCVGSILYSNVIHLLCRYYIYQPINCRRLLVGRDTSSWHNRMNKVLPEVLLDFIFSPCTVFISYLVKAFLAVILKVLGVNVYLVFIGPVRLWVFGWHLYKFFYFNSRWIFLYFTKWLDWY